MNKFDNIPYSDILFRTPTS